MTSCRAILTINAATLRVVAASGKAFFSEMKKKVRELQGNRKRTQEIIGAFDGGIGEREDFDALRNIVRASSSTLGSNML